MADLIYMPKPKQIAIILPDTLQCIGLRSILTDYFPPVEIDVFNSFDSFSLQGKESFDYYITLPETLVLHSDFFMLKRNRIIPVVLAKNTNENVTQPNILITDTTQEAIINRLRLLFTKEALCSSLAESNNELSMREIEVLQLIVCGITNKEIADRLYISLNTVLTHRKNITSKLGIKTIPGLTFYAITNGIISGDEIEL
ncbi:MAG: helix-turn-helix transcriptional regulator [Tannerella sp.]|jgi:DNA-binding CsgD family transcriptional regulator|nr:helix-turn-helix transcriptional regulator [Tannerella sp.]